MKKVIISLALGHLAISSLLADTVVTKNGSTINGTILEIDGGKLTIETPFGGKISIDQNKIERFETDNPIFVSTEDGSTFKGTVSGKEGALVVSSANGDINTNLKEINESWQPGKTSPAERRQTLSMKDLGRGWAHEATFDFTGKSGNSDSTGLAGSYRATLAGQDDKLEFYAGINYQEVDGAKSADDIKGGVQYTNNTGDKWNWYLRTEFGKDTIKAIDLYTNAALGFGRVLANTDTRSLDIRAGLGYRYEAYHDSNPLVIDATDREDLSAASLDLGLSHRETFKWGDLVNRITFTPTIEDFGNFRMVHDTSFQLPLKAEGWTLRFGFSTDYDSEAEASGNKELDITYYTRLALKWD